MKHRVFSAAVATFACLLLVACAATPPRAQFEQSDEYYQRRARFDCPNCGVVREIERVYIRDNATSGGGAVLGAIIGGILGNQIGHGRGRTAATVGGAVAGGFAGNAIERNSSGGGREAWQFTVRLDDGRWATVTQWDNGNLRPGDRVMIRDDRLMLLR